MSKPQGMCVFCGEAGVTKQHIIPDRLRAILGDPQGRYPQISDKTDYTADEIEPKIDVIIRQGAPNSRQIRKVCSECNSGWMRELEERAASSFERMVQGKSLTLNANQQKDVAAWACLMASMLEYTALDTAAIPERDRVHLMTHKTPPPNWRVWIGYYLGGDSKGVSANHYGYTTKNYKTFDEKFEPKANVQTSTFLLGRLAVHCFSHQSVVPYPYNINVRSARLSQIWPKEKDVINWQSAGSLNSYVGDILINYLQGIRYRLGDNL